MPGFSNQVVQAIEAGCLHLAETMVGMEVPTGAIIPILLARYNYLAPADAEVIANIAEQGRYSLAQLQELPPTAQFPAQQFPVEPTAAANAVTVTEVIEVTDHNTGEVIRIVTEVVVPEDVSVEGLLAILNQAAIDAIDRYNAELRGADFEYDIPEIYRGQA